MVSFVPIEVWKIVDSYIEYPTPLDYCALSSVCRSSCSYFSSDQVWRRFSPFEELLDRKAHFCAHCTDLDQQSRKQLIDMWTDLGCANLWHSKRLRYRDESMSASMDCCLQPDSPKPYLWLPKMPQDKYLALAWTVWMERWMRWARFDSIFGKCPRGWLQNSEVLLQDRGFVLAVAALDGGILEYASSFQSDYEVVRAAVHSWYVPSLLYIGEDLRAEKDIVQPILASIGSQGWLGDYPQEADEVLALASPLARELKYAAAELRDDKDVAIAAVSNRGLALRYVSPRLLKDRDVVLTAVASHGMALRYVDREFRADKALVMKAIENYQWAFVHASADLKADKEVAQAAVSKQGLLLIYCSPELRADRDVVMLAVKDNGMALGDASLELRDDPEVVLTAIRQNSAAINYASAVLQSDLEAVLAMDEFPLDTISLNTPPPKVFP